MTSSGRLLGGAMKYGDRNDLGPALERVLADYAKLPESERRPKKVEGEAKPQPAPPAGGLVLTIFDRPLGRGKDGLRLPEGKDFGGSRTHAPHGQRSSLWLTKDEVASLLPAEAEKDKTHPVPAKLMKRIALYGLVPQTLWVVEEMWKPDSLKEGGLSLTVEAADEKKVRLRLHGGVSLAGPSVLRKWPTGEFIKNLENRYDARLEGVLEYDPKSRKVWRFDLAAVGDYSGRWFAGNSGWKEATREAPMALGFAFELDASAPPPERRRPRSFVHAYIFREREPFYYDPEAWLEDWTKRGKR